MSGGYFDYKQYHIQDIKDLIQEMIDNNDIPDGDGYTRQYSKETIWEFQEAVEHLKIAYLYAQRIDYLRSGDDSEESFHTRLKEDVEKLFP